MRDAQDGWTTADYALKESLDSSHRAILDWMDRPAARVLDLGCSSGLLSQELRALGHYVVGVDVITHPEVKERTDEFYEADLDHGLPAGLPSDFDVVICGDVLEHVRRPEVLLLELATVHRTDAGTSSPRSPTSPTGTRGSARRPVGSTTTSGGSSTRTTSASSPATASVGSATGRVGRSCGPAAPAFRSSS